MLRCVISFTAFLVFVSTFVEIGTTKREREEPINVGDVFEDFDGSLLLAKLRARRSPQLVPQGAQPGWPGLPQQGPPPYKPPSQWHPPGTPWGGYDTDLGLGRQLVPQGAQPGWPGWPQQGPPPYTPPSQWHPPGTPWGGYDQDLGLGRGGGGGGMGWGPGSGGGGKGWRK